MNIITKGFIGILIIVIIFYSYETIVSDDFQNCERFFVTDKETYQVGDTILLTAVIVPEKNKKTIKVYRDFSNLYFYISYEFKSKTPDSVSSKFYRRADDTKIRYQNKAYDKIVITKESPYKHTFTGLFTYDSLTKIYNIDFNEYGYSFSFSKTEYEYFKSFGFRGIWYPVRAGFLVSLEESIWLKRIQLIF